MMTELNYCDELVDVIPAYALGFVDPGEEAEIERLLAQCPDITAELDEYLALKDAFMVDVPQIQPSATLKVQIMQAAAAKTTTKVIAPARWQGLLVAASIAVLAIVGVLFAALSGETESKLSEAELAMQTLLKREDVARFDLFDVREDKEGVTPEGFILCHPDETLVFIQVENFPELEPDQVYQIWLWKGDERISGGTFRVDENGGGVIMFNAPENMFTYDYVGINREPAPGSISPMGIPTTRAQLYVDVNTGA